MIVEAAAILFLGFWLYSEYSYNAYFHDYFNAVVVQNLGTYAVLSGLSLGLTASVATVALWKSLHRTRKRVASVTTPRLRATVERANSITPPHTESFPSLPGPVTINPLDSLDQPAQVGVADQQKK
jgi:hypothetical protein